MNPWCLAIFYYVTCTLLCVKCLLSENQGIHPKTKRESDAIVYPGSFTGSVSTRQVQEIPLDLIRQLNNVTNVTDLFENYIEPGHEDGEKEGSEVAFRFGSTDNVERKGLLSAKMAKCMPELKTVPLKQDKDPATYYYPPCTRVERCGGCCSHHLLSCQPVESEILQYSVVVTEYKGGNTLKYRGKEIIEVEQHTKCKCDCKIRPEDCSRYQKYNRERCKCECNNSDDEEKCYKDRFRKLWNPETCSCECREEVPCGSGYYYDFFYCSCVQDRSTRLRNPAANPDKWSPEFDRQFYNITK